MHQGQSLSEVMASGLVHLMRNLLFKEHLPMPHVNSLWFLKVVRLLCIVSTKNHTYEDLFILEVFQHHIYFFLIS